MATAPNSYRLPAASTGPYMDLVELDDGSGGHVERSVLAIGSPDAAGRAQIADVATTQTGTEKGLLVRIAGSVAGIAQDLSDNAGRLLGIVSISGDVPTTNASGSQDDGHSATLGSTADADTALTVVGLLKKIKALLSDTVSMQVPFGTRAHSFVAVADDTTQDVHLTPMSMYSLTAKADGTGSWEIHLQISNDNVNWTTVVTFTDGDDGHTLTTSVQLGLYWRLSCSTFTPGTMTTVACVAVSMQN